MEKWSFWFFSISLTLLINRHFQCEVFFVLLVMILKTSSVTFAVHAYATGECSRDLFSSFELAASHLKDASQAYRQSGKSCDSAHKSMQKLVTICSITVIMNVLSARSALNTLQPRLPFSRRLCNLHNSKMARWMQNIMYNPSILLFFFFFTLRPTRKGHWYMTQVYIFPTGEKSVERVTWSKIYDRWGKQKTSQGTTLLQMMFPTVYMRFVRKLFCFNQTTGNKEMPDPSSSNFTCTLARPPERMHFDSWECESLRGRIILFKAFVQ